VGLKGTLKTILPAGLVGQYHRRQREKLRARNRQLSVKEVFTRIYRDNEWHGKAGEFDSGYGSQSDMAAPYCQAAREFMETRGVKSVVDLGCGDFRVGAGLQASGRQYVGVDIVEELVAQNQARYGNANVSFRCLDLIADELPDADICLMRQVLQHLSNAQIVAVLAKLEKYRYVLVTEHYPAPGVAVTPNLDKPHGSDTRTFDNSGVYLDQPPFNLSGWQPFLEVEASAWLVKKGETIRTFLRENNERS
jgi:SAM-dependent methyltransferase